MSFEKDRVAKIYSEDCWFNLAVAALIISAVLLVFIAFWVWDRPDYSAFALAPRMEVGKALCVLLGAFTTIPTVIWRGLVSARQADEQRRSNDAKDGETRARLLLDGCASLEGNSHVAGLAALREVVTGPSGSIATSAMNALNGFLTECLQHAKTHDDREWKIAIEALSAGAMHGASATITVFLDASGKPSWRWGPMLGCNAICIGGSLSGANSREFTNHCVIFQNPLISYCDIPIDINIHLAHIHTCTIKKLDSASLFSVYRFIGCDFSNCVVGSNLPDKIYQNIASGGNFYNKSAPPIDSKNRTPRQDIMSILEER